MEEVIFRRGGQGDGGLAYWDGGLAYSGMTPLNFLVDFFECVLFQAC